MVCNEKSPKAKDDKYTCNEKTNRWILKSGKTGLKMKPKSKSPVKPKSKSPVKPKSKSPVKPKSKSAMKNKSCLDSKVALQPHQIQFAKSFVEMCKNKKSDKHGAIAVHSLGSGKTLTAITTSQCYLKLYPNDIVIIITPASLITNFQKEMIKWGVENPEKYHFFTYDAFKNNPINCSNSLLIIDEAHNLRTEVKLSDKAKKAIGTKKMKKGDYGEKNKGLKAADIINCAKKARKILLLTGTPVVNDLYDIENLMAMIHKRNPLTRYMYNKMNAEQMRNYFQCAISFFQSVPENFPTTKEHDIYIEMSQNYMKKYMYVEKNILESLHLVGFSDEKDITKFYNGLRQATTKIDSENSPKVQWVLNHLQKSKPKEKFVVFSHFKEAGSKLLEQVLNSNHIKHRIISGEVTKAKRQEYVDLYNKGKIKVLMITKAGGEGLNLLETRSIILMEPSWNETISNQVIGRAVRYKSHDNLPVDEQKVDIFKLYMIKPRENVILKHTLGKVTLPNIVEIIANDNPDEKPSIDIFLKGFSLKKQSKLNDFTNYLKVLPQFESCYSSNS